MYNLRFPVAIRARGVVPFTWAGRYGAQLSVALLLAAPTCTVGDRESA